MFPTYGKEWRDDYTEEADITKLNDVYKDTNKLPTETWEKSQTTVGKTSIEQYGGFYIARYEAGIPEEADFHISETNNNYVNTQNENITVTWTNTTTTHGRGSVADTGIIQDYKPVSKQGVQAWNYITQPNSKMVAENMYKDSKDSKENDVGVKSYLVDSQAWNHICSVIFEVGEGQNIDSTSYGNYFKNRTFTPKPGTLWTRHVNNNGKWTIATTYTTGDVKYSNQSGTTYEYTELATGSSDNFKKYNIYDMAGNMWEWTAGHTISTTQSTTQMFAAMRGGSFHSSNGAVDSVVCAGCQYDFMSYFFNVGFRVVLYIE